VYFTWEGEAGALEEAGVDISALQQGRTEAVDELEVEVRVLERMLSDAARQLAHLRDLIAESRKTNGGGRND
jgi:hypothetical protein